MLAAVARSACARSLLDVVGEAAALADEAQPHAVGAEFGDFAPQVVAQQAGEVDHLARGRRQFSLEKA